MSFISRLKKIKINGCKFLLKEIEYKYINDKIYENLENSLCLQKSTEIAMLEFNKNSKVKYFNTKQIKTFAKNFLKEEVGRNVRSLKRPHSGHQLSNQEVIYDTQNVSISIEINPMDSNGEEQLHYVCITQGDSSIRIPCSSKEQAQMISRNYNVNSF